MDELLEILNDLDDSIDYRKEEHLIDDHLLTSFNVILLISQLEDHFDISIDASEMTPENFNSAEAMYRMVQRLQNE